MVYYQNYSCVAAIKTQHYKRIKETPLDASR